MVYSQVDDALICQGSYTCCFNMYIRMYYSTIISILILLLIIMWLFLQCIVNILGKCTFGIPIDAHSIDTCIEVKACMT